MTLVLDAGALVAVERGDRSLIAEVKRADLLGQTPLTHGGVVARVWRGGRGRQVLLSRFPASVDVRPLDDTLGRRAGMLCGASGVPDAIDSALVCLAVDGDDIVTSDPGDLQALAEAADLHVDISVA
jgi:hypothetical protein